MSAKEAREKNEGSSERHQSQALVDVLWNDYLQRLNSGKKLVEGWEDDYLQMVGEVRQSLAVSRTTVEEFFRGLEKANLKVKEYFVQDRSDVQSGTDGSHDSGVKSTLHPLDSAIEKLSHLAWTPWRTTTEFLNAAESRWEDNHQEIVKVAKERRHAFDSLTNEWMNSIRRVQSTTIHMFGESMRASGAVNR